MTDRVPAQLVETAPAATAPDYDVVVVGAGLGGLYAVYRFLSRGFRVLALEAAGQIGGVWCHNRYPGARVDLESTDYCYFFSSELYADWRWTERYASQPELLRYLNHVADRFDLRRHIRLNTRLNAARWQRDRWALSAGDGQHLTARFLVMATGNLSEVRQPDFPGLEDYRGEWVQTSRWPERPVALKGRRIGIIGTGSSGVQAIPQLALEAAHLTVFQRSPNFSVPAQNGPLNAQRFDGIAARVPEAWRELLATRGGSHRDYEPFPASHYTEAERLDLLERKWRVGGQGMNAVFSDQGTNKAANDIVSEFVRNKIRAIVRDPAVAEKLCPKDHPMGSRRLCVDTGYYETYNRPNVTLVDVRADPIRRITETGIQTEAGHYDLDLIVFALGFDAFTGALAAIDIRNAEGAHVTDGWRRGPRTALGLMTAGFPNLFLPTGAGSPSVLANMFVGNQHDIDWIADCMVHLRERGLTTVEPTVEAQEAWGREVAAAASPLLRLHVRNYMVHVNADDGSRVFIPYVGGLGRYVETCARVARDGYAGFTLA